MSDIWDACRAIGEECEEYVDGIVDHSIEDVTRIQTPFTVERLHMLLGNPLPEFDWIVGSCMSNDWHVVLEETGLVAYPDEDDEEEEDE